MCVCVRPCASAYIPRSANLVQYDMMLLLQPEAFLQNRLPELSVHIDAHVAHLTDALKKEVAAQLPATTWNAGRDSEVDEEVAEQFLRTCAGCSICN